MKIGFIGLGEMGRPMVANLLNGGHDVTVWNRTAKRADELVAAGAKLAAAPADVCIGAEAVLVMLSDDHAVRAVMDAGLLEALSAPTVFVNTSTISVAYAQTLSRQIQEAGVDYVAAPVFGRPDVAAKAQLNIVVSGAAAAIDLVTPALLAIGSRLWPVGQAPECANVVKIGGNFMIASAIEAMAEASTFARAHGIAASTFLDVMTQTVFASRAYTSYAPMIAERRYLPAGFKVQLGLKDVELALTAASNAKVPMPMAALVRDALLDAVAHGGAEHDWSMLAEVSARRAGLTS